MYNDKYQILVIDKVLEDFKIIKKSILSNLPNAFIFSAQNEYEVEEYLTNISYDFKIVFLDCSFFKEDCEISKIMNYLPKTPVVMLGTIENINSCINSLNRGITDYLIKEDLNPEILYRCIIYNIERKKISIQLEQADNDYTVLFQLGSNPSWVYDVETFRFLDVNNAAVQHYGYTREEFLSMTIFEIRPLDEIMNLKKKIKENKNILKKISSGNFIHLKKDQTRIIMHIESVLINYKESKAKLVVADDVTKRNDHLQILEKQNEKLREIAWTQSHIVRAPVSRILGILEYLKNIEVDDHENKVLMEYLNSSVKELDRLIRAC